MAAEVCAEQQVRQATSGAAAALYIRRLIFDGFLKPGDRVNQDEVARALGISRIPVREALIAVEQLGWITIEPNRGAFVVALDEQSVFDHYEMIGMMYGFSVRKAIERSDSMLAEKLTQLAADFGAAEDSSHAQNAFVAYQLTMIDAANSPRIRVTLRAMTGLIPGNFFEAIPGAVEVKRRGLIAVARACEAGDADVATAEYATMMRGVADEVVEVFRAKGFFDRE
jgi:DNA-binding GntR family transcriptional regulator